MVLLGKWTTSLQDHLIDELSANRLPSKWRHPTHSAIVKKLLIDIGLIGTATLRDIWELRNQACSLLDAYMATSIADIHEAERQHIPRLPHAKIPTEHDYNTALATMQATHVTPSVDPVRM